MYHPDATRGQHDVSPSVRNARFRAITHAYGALRGRHGHGGAGAWDNRDSRDDAMRAELRRRSRRSRSAPSSTATADDSVQHGDDPHVRNTFVLLAFAAVSVPSLGIFKLLTDAFGSIELLSLL